MRAKKVKPDTFQDFYDSAPAEIKDYINRCEETPQSAEWHPEGNAKRHINIVFNRARRTGDIDLMLSAFFHDLGKADVTKPHPSGTVGRWSAKMHEVVSARLATKYRDWIEDLGGDFDKIHFIVSQHMRAKQEDEMRPAKRAELQKHHYYDVVKQFSKFDDMRNDWSNDTED